MVHLREHQYIRPERIRRHRHPAEGLEAERIASRRRDEAARAVFKATNAARAEARQCGDTWMEAAPPLAWNKDLAAAALAHSQDMAQQGYFAHKNKQGNEVSQRAEAQGYRWRHIGENISRGQSSAAEAVAGWINSPGHCQNLMNPRFTEFGAGIAIRQGKRPAAYWTQVFGAPR